MKQVIKLTQVIIPTKGDVEQVGIVITTPGDKAAMNVQRADAMQWTEEETVQVNAFLDLIKAKAATLVPAQPAINAKGEQQVENNLKNP